MSGNGTFGIGGAGNDYALRILPLRVAKPFCSNRFDSEREDGARDRSPPREEIARAKPSRFETDATPDWTAQHLNPAFVAQVLGQLLTENEYAARSARGGYGAQPGPLALACDLRI